jgi:hypothetical protein
MIAVNGKKVDVNDPNDVYAKRIKDGIKFLKDKFGFPIKLKYPASFAMKVVDQSGNVLKKPEWPAGKMIRYKETIEGETLSEEWQYFEKTTMVGDKSVLLPTEFIFDGHLLIDKKKIDLAYFLCFISPFCGNSMDEKIRTGNSPKYFYIEDKQQEAFEHINKDKEKMKVEYIIKTADEDLSMFDENNLRDRAIGYGIAGIEKMSVWEVQEALIMRLDFMYKGGDRDVYKNFLSESEKPEVTSLKAKISNAFERNIIGIKQAGAGNKWFYRDEEGAFTTEICKINPKFKLQPERIIDLANFFLSNEEAKQFFLDTIK